MSTMHRAAREWAIEPSAAALHREALVWDMVWPYEPAVGNDFPVLERFRRSGHDFVSIEVGGDDADIATMMRRIAKVRAYLGSRPTDYVLVERTADILAAKSQGKLAVSLQLAGLRCLDRDLDLIDLYYALGVRHALLAFNVSNSFAGGCADALDGGVTRLGRRAIERMDRVGMLLDLSHTGRRSSLQAMEITSNPVIFSHSDVDAVHSHWRNVTDEQIKACAEKDGVIGISGSSDYLGVSESSNEAMFRHIDHVTQLVGPRHVGLGTDYVADAAAILRYFAAVPDEWPTAEGASRTHIAYATPEQRPGLTELLLRSGYPEPDVRGILGENFLRVCRQVWR